MKTNDKSLNIFQRDQFRYDIYEIYRIIIRNIISYKMNNEILSNKS